MCRHIQDPPDTCGVFFLLDDFLHLSITLSFCHSRVGGNPVILRVYKIPLLLSMNREVW